MLIGIDVLFSTAAGDAIARPRPMSCITGETEEQTDEQTASRTSHSNSHSNSSSSVIII